MKKLIMSLALIAGVTLGAAARDEYAHDSSVLPETAQATINNNFRSDVSVIKIDRTLGVISEYEVTLSDGTEISFDRHGDWESIETNKSKYVPSSIVLKPITDYVAQNYDDARIVGLERGRLGYEVDLSNGVDLHFTHSGKFVKVDR